jgi:hypothetical protein
MRYGATELALSEAEWGRAALFPPTKHPKRRENFSNRYLFRFFPVFRGRHLLDETIRDIRGS